MTKKLLSLRCPTCRELVLASNENFPFCSDRCRVIDLGKWASGAYKISTTINDPEMLESMAEEESQRMTLTDEESSPNEN